MNSIRPLALTTTSLCIYACILACTGPRNASEPAQAAAHTQSAEIAPATPNTPANTVAAALELPWPDDFKTSAILLADEIEVSGPKGLLAHIALRQDPDLIDYRMETTSAGLLQEARARADAGYVEIRAQLDNWAVVAMQRMTILERPGDVPVEVRARGNAVWHPANGAPEQRGAEFVHSSANRSSP